MMFQKRIDRAFKKQKEDREERDAALMAPPVNPNQELYLEKGDFFAMVLAGFLTLLLPALLILAAICGIGLLLFT